MRDVLHDLRQWRSEAVGVGRAVVIRTHGSAPRPVGATLLVADDGRIAGSISGGCVEGAAIEEIRAARRGGYRRVVGYGISDEQGWSVGLACGGMIDVLVEPDIRPEVEDAASGPRSTAVATWLPVGDGPSDVPALVVGPDGHASGSLGDAESDETVAATARTLIAQGVSGTVALTGGEVFVEVLAAVQRLVIVGAGEIAVHLAVLAGQLGFRTVIVDPRGAFATRDRFPTADAIILGWPDEVADEAGIDEDADVVVVSHDPKLDEPAIATALARNARYVGAIGSRQTQLKRRAALLEAGLAQEQVDRLRGPIGLDIGAHTPAEIALAILAEVVANRHGRSGRPLTAEAAAPRSLETPIGPG